MMLKWFSKSCDGVKYLLKTDDDMYNNLPKLRDFVTTLEVQRVSDIFIGSLLCTSIPERDPGHKWFMSPESVSLVNAMFVVVAKQSVCDGSCLTSTPGLTSPSASVSEQPRAESGALILPWRCPQQIKFLAVIS